MGHTVVLASSATRFPGSNRWAGTCAPSTCCAPKPGGTRRTGHRPAPPGRRCGGSARARAVRGPGRRARPGPGCLVRLQATATRDVMFLETVGNPVGRGSAGGAGPRRRPGAAGRCCAACPRRRPAEPDGGCCARSVFLRGVSRPPVGGRARRRAAAPLRRRENAGRDGPALGADPRPRPRRRHGWTYSAAPSTSPRRRALPVPLQPPEQARPDHRDEAGARAVHRSGGRRKAKNIPGFGQLFPAGRRGLRGPGQHHAGHAPPWSRPSRRCATRASR